MNRRMRANQSCRSSKNGRTQFRFHNKAEFVELFNWLFLELGLFSEDEFHGNTQWMPELLVAQAIIWSWQETRFVTDAFDHAKEICDDLNWTRTANSYTSFMNALSRYGEILRNRLRDRYQVLAGAIGNRFFRTYGWVLIGFDGSRVTAPRTISNEGAFCAPNYGKGKRAKYGRKKSKGMRRKRNKQNPPQPQAPQAWITMMWHMGLRLPWSWRLGPSNASERDDVKEMLAEEEFPENTLFCGDAGFTGYPLWSAIVQSGYDFVVRVGGNVNLLSEHADVKRQRGGIVLCWPKGKIDSGEPPLRLRLVQVQVGKSKMWLLTSVLDRKRLRLKHLVRIYKMRWGIEVEYRGLKQTIDKHTLRCRNSDRLLVELDWSLRGMAIGELLALREQIAVMQKNNSDYDPKDRSLANTIRAIRRCMRNLCKPCNASDKLSARLSRATVQRYKNHTDKRARYRPRNPDKKPIGDPNIRKMNSVERKKLKEYERSTAA